MNKYGKRDAERAALVASAREARLSGAYAASPPPLCFCGKPATISETRRGGALKLYCAAHEHLATLD